MYNFLYVEKIKIKLEIINLNEFNEIINLKFNQLLECNFKFLNEILGFIQLGFLNIFILLSIFLILVLSIIKSSAINKKIQLIYFFIILIVLFFLFFLNLQNNIYNYIILMPVISLYFGEIISQQHQFLKFNKKISSLLIILVMLYFIGSSLITYTKMIRKWSGSGTYAGTSNILSIKNNCNPYCLFFDNKNKYKKLISNTGINQINYHPIKEFDELLFENNINFPIILNFPNKNHLNYLKNNYKNWNCYILAKSSLDHLIVYLPQGHNKPNFLEESKEWHLKKSCY